MHIEILSAVFLPFLGTVIGSAFVFFLKGQMNRTLQRSHLELDHPGHGYL